MEPEIECFDPATGKSDGFGELKGGLMVTCSLQTCRQYVPPRHDAKAERLRLLDPKFPLLTALAGHFPFETAVGLNGRIWFKAGTVGQTIALKRVLEGYDAGEIGKGKGEVDKAVKGFLA